MTAFEYNLKQLLEEEKLHIGDLQRSLGDNKDSKLYIRQREGAYYFTKSTNRKEKGITNNSEEIEQLLRIEKTSLELKLAENNYNRLTACLLKMKKINDEIIARHESRFKELEVYKVPFIYEKELYINGRHLFPDFTIRKRDGSIVIWEHFGLMDNPEYSERAMEKIQLYRQAGFVQCQNLICTYEEDIASVTAIDNIIKKFIFF